jgi:hypothetical protein
MLFYFLIIFLSFTCFGKVDSPVTWDGPFEIATGPGTKGPWHQNESNFDYVDDGTIAASGDTILIAWTDQKKKDIFFQRRSEDTLNPLSRPINISRSEDTFSWLPRFAVSKDDPEHVYLVWQEIIFSGGSHGGDILFASSHDGGKTFSTTVNLSHSSGGDGKGRISKNIWDNGSFDIVTGADGKVIVAWTEYHGSLWVSSSENHGKTFSPPQKLKNGSDTFSARGPALAIYKDNVYLAWSNGSDANADIMIMTSEDGGKNFGNAYVTSKTKAFSDAPKLAVDINGTIHLAYTESNSTIFYTRSTDKGKTFRDPINISDTDSRYPYLAVDTNNNVYVAWEKYPVLSDEPKGMGMSVSEGKEINFSEPFPIRYSASPDGGYNGSLQGQLMEKIAVNESGKVFIINSSFTLNRQSRIWIISGKIKDS